MIKSVNYKSYPELKISDHKPVSASFDSQVSKYISIDFFVSFYSSFGKNGTYYIACHIIFQNRYVS